jgi:hypothetical protein
LAIRAILPVATRLADSSGCATLASRPGRSASTDRSASTAGTTSAGCSTGAARAGGTSFPALPAFSDDQRRTSFRLGVAARSAQAAGAANPALSTLAPGPAGSTCASESGERTAVTAPSTGAAPASGTALPAGASVPAAAGVTTDGRRPSTVRYGPASSASDPAVCGEPTVIAIAPPAADGVTRDADRGLPAGAATSSAREATSETAVAAVSAPGIARTRTVEAKTLAAHSAVAAADTRLRAVGAVPTPFATDATVRAAGRGGVQGLVVIPARSRRANRAESTGTADSTIADEHPVAAVAAGAADEVASRSDATIPTRSAVAESLGVAAIAAGGPDPAVPASTTVAEQPTAAAVTTGLPIRAVAAAPTGAPQDAGRAAVLARSSVDAVTDEQSTGTEQAEPSFVFGRCRCDEAEWCGGGHGRCGLIRHAVSPCATDLRRRGLVDENDRDRRVQIDVLHDFCVGRRCCRPRRFGREGRCRELANTRGGQRLAEGAGREGAERFGRQQFRFSRLLVETRCFGHVRFSGITRRMSCGRLINSHAEDEGTGCHHCCESSDVNGDT